MNIIINLTSSLPLTTSNTQKQHINTTKRTFCTQLLLTLSNSWFVAFFTLRKIFYAIFHILWTAVDTNRTVSTWVIQFLHCVIIAVVFETRLQLLNPTNPNHPMRLHTCTKYYRVCSEEMTIPEWWVYVDSTKVATSHILHIRQLHWHSWHAAHLHRNRWI